MQNKSYDTRNDLITLLRNESQYLSCIHGSNPIYRVPFRDGVVCSGAIISPVTNMLVCDKQSFGNT